MTFPKLESADSNQLSITLVNDSGFKLPLTDMEIEEMGRGVLISEGCNEGIVEIIYMTPEEISRLNYDFLGNTYITDNIAFRYEEEGDPMEATIAQCPFRIEEQAMELKVLYRVEFARVLIHGLLHICGFDDSTAEEKERMTNLEDHYLGVFGHT